MEQLLDTHETNANIKPRNWVIAFLCSLVLPGLGQVYNGQPKKAAILFLLPLLLITLFGLTRGATFFYGLVAIGLIEMGFRIYTLIDGVKHASRQQSYLLKPYNTWYFYLLIAASMYAIIYLFETGSVLGIKTFTIPSVSNHPTLKVGDYVVADMRAYEKKAPDYGDIVAYAVTLPDGLDCSFDGSANEVMYTFRVVGLPNDRIDIIDNIVTVNGNPCKAIFQQETTCDIMPVLEFEEVFPNGHKHLMYKFKQPFDSTKANISHVVVPSDSYYVMGDNRDNAADSRYSGCIKSGCIKGRVVYSYWGQPALERINIDFRDK